MSNQLEVKVPDIGDFDAVLVIEVLVSPGDTVEVEDALVTLESDKATMDVPSPAAGVVESVAASVGDNLAEGGLILVLRVTDAGDAPDDTPTSPPAQESPAAATESDVEISAAADSSAASAEEPQDPVPSSAAVEPAPALAKSSASPAPTTPASEAKSHGPTGRRAPTATLASESAEQKAASHATPTVRRFARELGVDLSQVKGTGRKGRVLNDDIKRFVKAAVANDGGPAAGKSSGGMGIPAMPEVDFSKWGEVTTQPLSRIRRLSGPHLHRAWLNVPHVTHHDEADITELEAFRAALKDDAVKEGVRMTPLVFIMKAVAACLEAFPTFNASLAADGQSLVMKHYCHLGVAMDTPNGLIVPVLRDVRDKGLMALAAELGEVSERARAGKLRPDELNGGSMSISSLGGIGGIGFTPIVNAPEVAILGVSRSRMSAVWDGANFVPRLLLPLDLSYDHRVIDGAEAARFVVHLTRLLGDVRRLLL